MQSIVDQNVVMRRMTLFNMTGNVCLTLGHIQCGFVALDIQHVTRMHHIVCLVFSRLVSCLV